MSSWGTWHRTPIATDFGPLERAGNAAAPVASSFAKHTLKVWWDLELGVRYCTDNYFNIHAPLFKTSDR